MAENYRHKIICDPVHRERPVSELEQKLIDSRSFQRLRNLKQLGLASLVYPNATHTRFAHSLGVFRIMSRVIDLFVERDHFGDDDRRKLRIAALLHDIGHYPYSHLMEFIDRDKLRPALLRPANGKQIIGGDATARYPSHEKIGELIIEKRSDIAEVLTAAKLDPKEIGSMIRGQHTNPAYNRLTHSSLDVDRMDYLVRDSLGTGVPYGQIDLDYLLNNMDVVSENNEDGKEVADVVLAEKASAAAEHFLVARYFMHRVVYFHKTTFGLEALLRQILFLMRQKGLIYADGDAVELAIENDGEFFAFHDGYVDTAVQAAASAQDYPLAELCQLLLTRTPPKLLCEVASLRTDEGQHRNEYVLFRNDKARRIEELAKEYAIPKEFWIWEDLPKDISFESMGPSIALSKVDDLKAEEAAELIRIRSKDGTVRRLLEDSTSIIHHLSKLKLQASRLYLARRVEPAVLQKIREKVNSWSRPT